MKKILLSTIVIASMATAGGLNGSTYVNSNNTNAEIEVLKSVVLRTLFALKSAIELHPVNSLPVPVNSLPVGTLPCAYKLPVINSANTFLKVFIIFPLELVIVIFYNSFY